jgi:hypothetical protein
MKYLCLVFLFTNSAWATTSSCDPDWRTWMKCENDRHCTTIADECGIPRWSSNKKQISKMDRYRECLKKIGKNCPTDLDPMVLKPSQSKCHKRICKRLADIVSEAIVKDNEVELGSTLKEAGDIDLPLSHIFETALTLAAMNARPKLVRLLISKGAKVNHQTSNRYTALIFAAMSTSGDAKDRIETVKILLGKGADKSARNTYGESAEDAAKNAKNLEIWKLIRAAP